MQPMLERTMCDYQEKIIPWNPCALKNLAVFYQFRTPQRVSHFDYPFFKVVPDACLDFLFSCNPDDNVAMFHGPATTCKYVFLKPDQAYFGVRPYCEKGFKKFSFSFSELINESVPLDMLMPCQKIQEDLVSANSFEERINIFLQFAKETLIDWDYHPDFLELSKVFICHSKGNIPLEALAHTIGYSDRYLRKKFSEQFGISLKQYSRILRFQRSLSMLLGPDNYSFLEIAHESGYYDQAHFIKEYQKFLYTTPAEFKQEMLAYNA